MTAIIGAGPLGLISGLIAQKAGRQFQIFESASYDDWNKIESENRIGMTISDRGLEALKYVGVATEVLSKSIPISK